VRATAEDFWGTFSKKVPIGEAQFGASKSAGSSGAQTLEKKTKTIPTPCPALAAIFFV